MVRKESSVHPKPALPECDRSIKMAIHLTIEQKMKFQISDLERLIRDPNGNRASFGAGWAKHSVKQFETVSTETEFELTQMTWRVSRLVEWVKHFIIVAKATSLKQVLLIQKFCYQTLVTKAFVSKSIEVLLC